MKTEVVKGFYVEHEENNLYWLKDGNKAIIFSKEKDYINYKDYLENGLKLISKSNREYRFNDGSRLIDCSLNGNKKYTLHKRNKTYTNSKYMKKYLSVLNLI